MLEVHVYSHAAQRGSTSVRRSMFIVTWRRAGSDLRQEVHVYRNAAEVGLAYRIGSSIEHFADPGTTCAFTNRFSFAVFELRTHRQSQKLLNDSPLRFS